MWDSPPAVGSYSVATVEWAGITGPREVVQDMTLGTSRPLYIDTTPPQESLCGAWFNYNDLSILGATGAQIAVLGFGPNTIIDLEMDIILQNTYTSVSSNAGVAITSTNAGVVGYLYTGYLDGIAGPANLPPYGRAGIV